MWLKMKEGLLQFRLTFNQLKTSYRYSPLCGWRKALNSPYSPRKEKILSNWACGAWAPIKPLYNPATNLSKTYKQGFDTALWPTKAPVPLKEQQKQGFLSGGQFSHLGGVALDYFSVDFGALGHKTSEGKLS